MTPSSPEAHLGPLKGAFYCVGALLILISLMDYAGSVLPAQLGNVGWRYGAVGLISSFALTPLLGGVILLGTAALSRQRAVLRAVGLLHLVVAVLLLVAIGSFALDALQVRRGSPPESQRVTEISAIKAGVELALTVVASAWLGLAGLRLSRPRGPARPAKGNVVVGTP